MIKSGHLKRNSEDALQINLKAASGFTYTLKKYFIITITDGEEIAYYANDNFFKTSTYSTKELIVQAHYSISGFSHQVYYVAQGACILRANGAE